MSSEYVRAVGNIERLTAIATASPADYYRINSSLHERGVAIGIRHEFDLEAVEERCEERTEATTMAREGLTAAVVTSMVEADAFSDGSGAIEFILNSRAVEDAAGSYAVISRAAYEEISFWAIQRGDMGMLMSFFRSFQDPVHAKRFLEQLYYVTNYAWRTAGGDSRLESRREAYKKRRAEDMRRMIDAYAEEQNRQRLRSRLEGSRFPAALLVGAQTLFKFGKEREANKVIAEISQIAEMEPVTEQVIRHATA